MYVGDNVQHYSQHGPRRTRKSDGIGGNRFVFTDSQLCTMQSQTRPHGRTAPKSEEDVQELASSPILSPTAPETTKRCFRVFEPITYTILSENAKVHIFTYLDLKSGCFFGGLESYSM